MMGATNNTNVTNRRRYEHIPFSVELTVVDLADNRRYKGHSVNFSLGGVGFYCERFFESGARVAVVPHLRGVPEHRLRPITVTIRWSRVESDGAVMGAEFSQVLSATVHPELYEALCNR